MAQERDGDERIGGRAPSIAEAEGFAAQDDGNGAGIVDVRVDLVGFRRGRDDRDPLSAQPGERFVGGGFGDGHGKERAETGAHDVGVMEIGRARGDDDAVQTGGVGGPQDCAEVAGLFDAFDHGEKGRVRRVERVEVMFQEWDDKQQPAAIPAERKFGEYLRRDLGEPGATTTVEVGQFCHRGPGLRVEQFRADKGLQRFDAARRGRAATRVSLRRRWLDAGRVRWPC